LITPTSSEARAAVRIRLFGNVTYKIDETTIAPAWAT